MSKLIMLSLGGSGERVMNSVVMLLAAGVRLHDPNGADMTLVPVFLDTDNDSYALKTAKEKIQEYQKLQSMIKDVEWGDKTMFRTKIENPVDILIDGHAMGNLKTLIGETTFDDDKKAELEMLFSPEAIEVGLGMGFIGMPNIGTIALNYLLCSPEFQTVMNNLQEGDRVFFVSSIFGGTGAAGFPLILNKLQGLDIIKKDDNKIALGAVTLLPYFGFTTETEGPENLNGFTVDADQFDSKSYAAFMYYDSNLDKSRVSSQYFIGNPDKSLFKKCLGGDKQSNPASLLETMAATSLFHFAKNAVPLNSVNKETSYYEYWSGKDGSHEYSLDDIHEEDVKKALVRFQMFEYLMKGTLMAYTNDNPGVVANHYGFKSSDCDSLTAKFKMFFNLYDKWRNEVADSSHRASMKFDYFKHEPGENQYITECFNPNISTTHKEGGFLGIGQRSVVAEPDFLNKMSEALGNHASSGWPSDKRERFTLYLLMTAIEKVLDQTDPYKIVNL